MIFQNPGLLGVILAGGQGKRLGFREKAFEMIAGTTCLARVRARLADQIPLIAVSTSSNAELWRACDLPILPDVSANERQGPLSGILSSLRYAGELGCAGIIAAPVDTPFLPMDLVARLSRALDDSNADIAVAASDRVIPVVGLWRASLLPAVEAAFREGIRAPRTLIDQLSSVVVTWPSTPFDPFANLNEERDRGVLELMAQTFDGLQSGHPRFG